MSLRQFITVQIPSSNERFDLEVPSGQSISDILPLILRGLNYSPVNASDGKAYALWKADGSSLDPSRSFQQEGIENFSILVLDSTAPNAPDDLEYESAADEIHSVNTPVIEFYTNEPVMTELPLPEPQQETAAPVPESEEPQHTEVEVQPGQERPKFKSIQELVAIRKEPGLVKPKIFRKQRP